MEKFWKFHPRQGVFIPHTVFRFSYGKFHRKTFVIFQFGNPGCSVFLYLVANQFYIVFAFWCRFDIFSFHVWMLLHWIEQTVFFIHLSNVLGKTYHAKSSMKCFSLLYCNTYLAKTFKRFLWNTLEYKFTAVRIGWMLNSFLWWISIVSSRLKGKVISCPCIACWQNHAWWCHHRFDRSFMFHWFYWRICP